jgi:hypothetical protein
LPALTEAPAQSQAAVLPSAKASGSRRPVPSQVTTKTTATATHTAPPATTTNPLVIPLP